MPLGFERDRDRLDLALRERERSLRPLERLRLLEALFLGDLLSRGRGDRLSIIGDLLSRGGGDRLTTNFFFEVSITSVGDGDLPTVIFFDSNSSMKLLHFSKTIKNEIDKTGSS